MLYKDHIRKIILEVVSAAYGHWIGPDGKAFDVNYSHEMTAIEVIRDLLKRGRISQAEYDELHIPLNSTTEVENFIYRRGWIRGVKSDNDYYANGTKNQRLTPKQERWLKEYGEDNNKTVVFLPKGEDAGMRGTKIIHDAPNSDIRESTESHPPISKENEKKAKFFIFNVWRLMPKDDRYSPYQFSLWMDNETHLQRMKERLANEIFPNEDDAQEKFFYDIVTPTIEKMEQEHYNRIAKKINTLDPLFILKSVVHRKTFEAAKKALFSSHLYAWSYTGGKVSDDDAQKAFERLYRHAMGETAYSKDYVEKLPRLSDLRQPTNDTTERIFIQQYAGYSVEKFPDVVKVWRGTNSPTHKIKAGDFVTFDRDYAESYSRGKFKAIITASLPSNDLRIYKMDVNDSELIYWPAGHEIKKFAGQVPSFKEFWEMYR